MAAIIPDTSPLNPDGSFGVNRVLKGCKRLKANLSIRLIDEYKSLMKDIIIDNQSFKKFKRVAPIGELRK
ncbi:MAG: hypothetical protein U0V54_16095 [Saprospiraceae bacterium]